MKDTSSSTEDSYYEMQDRSDSKNKDDYIIELEKQNEELLNECNQSADRINKLLAELNEPVLESEWQKLEKQNKELKSILKLWSKNKNAPKEYNDIVNKYFWDLV